jgi:hypothetical protein
MATALVNMKYYLLNAPLAARVCTATSNSQVSRELTTNLFEHRSVIEYVAAHCAERRLQQGQWLCRLNESAIASQLV